MHCQAAGAARGDAGRDVLFFFGRRATAGDLAPVFEEEKIWAVMIRPAH